MQKEAWICTIAGTVLGALGCLLRWLQCEMIFDEVTGLPTKGAGISTLMVLLLALMTAGLWWLSGRISVPTVSEEPEDAMTATNKVVSGVLIFASLVAGAGAAYMFLTEESTLLRVTALLGLLSAPLPALYPSLSRWGGFGALLSLFPVVFFSVWLVAFYKDHAVNPVVWEYGMEILTITVCLFAAYRVSGCMYYRLHMRRTVFACMLALTICLTILMDRAPASARFLLLGWGLGFGGICWLLLRSVPVPEEEQ